MSEKSTNKLAVSVWWVLSVVVAVAVAVFLTRRSEGGLKIVTASDSSAAAPESRADARPAPASARSADAPAPPEATKGESAPAATPDGEVSVVPRQAMKDPAPKNTGISRPRVESNATKRLSDKPQIFMSALKTTGRGENADWGISKSCAFDLTFVVECETKIERKSETVLGKIEVVEKRFYRKARQELKISDCDVALSLRDTLPLEYVGPVVENVSGALAGAGMGGWAMGAKVMGDAVNRTIGKLDGMSLKGVFSMFGVNVPTSVQQQVDKFVSKVFKSIPKLEILEGKTYLVTYYQDKDTQAPLHVEFTNGDGSPIETEEEWMVLRRANAFIDSKVVPDRNCSPGDNWKVDAGDFDCLLDPYVEGGYSGEVEVSRKDDDAEGNWILAVAPGSVSIVSDAGKPAGEIQITDGCARVDGRRALVKAMEVTGRGGMKHLNKHHLLFQTRFEGNCSFRALMTTQQK